MGAGHPDDYLSEGPSFIFHRAWLHALYLKHAPSWRTSVLPLLVTMVANKTSPCHFATFYTYV